MELKTVLEYALRKAEALGVSEAEVYVREVSSTSIRRAHGDLGVVKRGSMLEIGVRVVINRRVAVQGGNVSELSDVDKLVEAAVRSARVAAEDPHWKSLPRGLSKTPVEMVWDRRVVEPDVEGMVEEIRNAFALASQIDKRCHVSLIDIQLSEIRRVIGNSYGEVVDDSVTRVNALVHVKAVEGGEESGFYEYFSASTLTGFNLENMVAYATERAASGLYAKRIETGKYSVVLISKVFASIINTLIVPAVSIEWVKKERSPLKGKLGEQVFSDAISIVDDGAAQNLASSASFDDEGIRMQRKVVVDRGVLEGYLYDYYYSVLESKEPSGNGIRPTISSAPRPWATNFIILPGSASREDLIRDVRRGVVVYQTIGEWLSNPVNGFLNATITNGVLIEDGEPKRAVKGVVLSGNVYELLKSKVIGVANDVDNYANVYAPSIALESVVIAGK
ncbi:MAG TPA: TldD/PmbA family protein [Ignisphaera aggregans]|uniref:TldD/PmbA family protein n=1 Tax=Ignisphaera aggregans TaxID=334771 RepID=A0A832Z0R1_9CREN|nr:TldD/PmbA family protein [Ignisphaera aggregans]